MADDFASAAIAEIELVRDECLKLIGELKAFCPLQDGQQYPEVFRLMATPMLYSAWERCFTLCHAIALRVLQDIARKPVALSSVHRAIWLIRTPFFDSLRTRLSQPFDRGPKRGHFTALCEFLAEFEKWSQSAFDSAADTGELVMTFSNVSPDVVEVNARAVGFASIDGFEAFKLGKLHDLVGQRNGIGHGSTIEAPKHAAFVELVEFTEKLISHYCQYTVEWVRQQGGQTSSH